MATIPKKFADEFNRYADFLKREFGETQDGISEIKQAIRDDWSDPEKQILWTNFIAQKVRDGYC